MKRTRRGRLIEYQKERIDVFPKVFAQWGAGTASAIEQSMKTFKLAVFNHPNNPAPLRMVIRELDTVLEAVWAWEVKQHGKHAERFKGRVVYEAVVELQEYVMSLDD